MAELKEMNMSRVPAMRRSRMPAFLLFPLIVTFATSAAFALTSGQSPQGWAFLDGGVGRSEIESMDIEKGKFSLWVITAARVSGAYLADVDVSITDEKGNEVFERKLQGPWLFINLPLGRYEVRGRVGPDSVSRVTTIHPGDHHQMVLYFDIQGEAPARQ
jgi:hypothetical protein